MPVNLMINKEKIKKNVSEIRKSIKEEEELLKDVIENTKYYMQLSKSSFNRIVSFIGALNKFLGIFGAGINISGLDLTDIADAINKLSVQLDKSKKDTDKELNELEAIYLATSDTVNQAVIDSIRNIRENSKGEITWPDFQDTKIKLLASFKDTRDSARQIDSIVSKIGFFFDLADKIGGDFEVIVGNIRDLIKTVIDKIFDILDAVDDAFLALRGAAIAADNAPFNLFPGTLAVALGLLAEVSATLKTLSDELLGITNSTKGVSSAAKRLAILVRNYKDIGLSAAQATGYVPPPVVED